MLTLALTLDAALDAIDHSPIGERRRRVDAEQERRIEGVVARKPELRRRVLPQPATQDESAQQDLIFLET